MIAPIHTQYKKILAILFLACMALQSTAQIPAGYYASASGKSGAALQQALHDVVAGHTQVTYAELWTYFQQTDKTATDKVWDIYSDVPGGTPPYFFTFGTNQCGSYGKEGDCYNREHTFCQSWFKDGSPIYTDMFHLYPTDGYVNGRRGNNPFGEVGSTTWTSKNGSKLGECASPGYTGTAFEPIDAYKGDIARGFFYIATRYYGEDAGFPGSDMVSGSQLKPWARALMMKWAKLDPVSQKEIDRNNAIYKIQKNRNPFIDHPEYIELIWNNLTGINDNRTAAIQPVYPNPSSGVCSMEWPDGLSQTKNIQAEVFSASGQRVNVPFLLKNGRVEFDLSALPRGIYCIRLSDAGNNQTCTGRVIRK